MIFRRDHACLTYFHTSHVRTVPYIYSISESMHRRTYVERERESEIMLVNICVAHIIHQNMNIRMEVEQKLYVRMLRICTSGSTILSTVHIEY